MERIAEGGGSIVTELICARRGTVRLYDEDKKTLEDRDCVMLDIKDTRGSQWFIPLPIEHIAALLAQIGTEMAVKGKLGKEEHRRAVGGGVIFTKSVNAFPSAMDCMDEERTKSTTYDCVMVEVYDQLNQRWLMAIPPITAVKVCQRPGRSGGEVAEKRRLKWNGTLMDSKK